MFDALNAKPDGSVILSIEQVSVVPEFRQSHTILLVDLYRNEILMFSGRRYRTKKPHRECYSYLISTNQWVKSDELRLTQSITSYEARGFIQLNNNVTDDFSLSWLVGGQNVHNRVVPHEILGVKLFRDPSKNKNRTLSFYDIYSLDLLPQHLGGSCVTIIPNHTKINLLFLGGSLSEGPYCSSSIYEWIPPSNKVLSELPADISI
jgi:hypothetical protein